MKLFILYGPPGVGKFTIGRKLAAKTDYKLLHNHLTIEPLRKIFPFASKPFIKLNRQWRLNVIETCAQNNINLIFTFVYAHPIDLPYIKKIQRAVKKHGGTVEFFALNCPRHILLRRITSAIRKKQGKITSPQEMKEIFGRYDLFSPIPGVPSMRLNTGQLTAAQAAQKIMAVQKTITHGNAHRSE
ncbi:MAG: hypothetical protein A3F54_05765 [Candidatus Kerfeldbacteria bacterium RIFCSPHIGHO2_12_FULL_48_17]|uniref:Shikimate kinase n=1 Tax=Candidatus Kerfeldbacteria bacterium RIFCSPHIGHO2_12_FULL_48_17 TaxID=1798542 RepID=A0A1G2B5W8_9BACT|nr:MAG: hypothetical protein A3F54_05765 [Candidatus Kerfeldbacteria bacterium RIFCSPHIGHO2_12_FULL_48_17]